ncbi:unnamed protein product [Litomosoides sigmodontis]|uniref:C6 domain-containing protein n=1 Tax=Litomosoides sigmodontis TaxID=42156 RepID=A0A3P6U0W6_LITSI|nr:unnamed protein product [Litomosoides sigmodontis]
MQKYDHAEQSKISRFIAPMTPRTSLSESTSTVIRATGSSTIGTVKTTVAVPATTTPPIATQIVISAATPSTRTTTATFTAVTSTAATAATTAAATILTTGSTAVVTRIPVTTTSATITNTIAPVRTTTVTIPTTTAAVPTTSAAAPTATTVVSRTTATVPATTSAVPATTAAISTTTIPATKSTVVIVSSAIPSSKMVTQPIVPSTSTTSTTNSQFRDQYVSENLTERFILQVNKTRSKRQMKICEFCDNIPALTVENPASGERNGRLSIVYGTNKFGCRTAKLICEADSLTMQIAIIYANGMKSSPLARSPTGTVQLTLTCDENACWKAPNSMMNIWNVTCLLRDHPIPTATTPSTTTLKPCSACVNIRGERVRNPAATERDGKLIIEYTHDEFGCRVATILCNTVDEDTEAVIYFNGMKNLPAASSRSGRTMVTLVCGDNTRFSAEDSRVSVESVTCLSRDIIPPMPHVLSTTPAEPCSTCVNIRGERVRNPAVTESNGKLIIEYTHDEFGCRVATVICNTIDADAEAVIYFNGMKNLPAASSTSGSATVTLVCGENIRFRAVGSRVNVESVTCLSRDIIPPVPRIPPTTPAEPCSACADIRGERVRNPAVTESDGKLIIEYMHDEFGCRVATILCNTVDADAEAVIYFNGMKNLPAASNRGGRATITLVCGDNIRFRAVGSRVNVESVTCLSRDIVPPTPHVPSTPSEPCSACVNIRGERVRNPAVTESNGKLIIEYTHDEFGCRVATVICNTIDADAEAVIYFNGMKNLPAASSTSGSATVTLVCGENIRFRAVGSRVNVESVTCLSRGYFCSYYYF